MRKQFPFPLSSRHDLGGRRWCLFLSSYLMSVRRNVQRKKNSALLHLLLSLPLSLFMVVSFKYFHWQFLFHEGASLQHVCVERSRVLQGGAAAGLGGPSAAAEGGARPQCGINGEHRQLGSLQRGCGAASLDKAGTHHCSLPVKVPLSPIRLWLRHLKAHSFLRYLCQRITPNTNDRSLSVILDRCKIFTAAFK